MRTHFEATFASVIVAVAIAATAAESAAAPGDVTVLTTLDSPHPSPDGLAFDGQALWVSDCQSTRVYRVAPDTGETIESFDFPFMVDHIDHRGDYVWLSDHTNFYRIDGASLESTDEIAAPWDTAMGVAEEGQGVWSADPEEALIHKVDAAGQIVTTVPSPGGNPCGVGWDGRCLWVSDLTDQRFYQIDPLDGSIELSLLAPPGAATTLPTGIAFWGDRIWVADEDPGNPKLYEIAFEPVTEGPCAIPTDPEPGQDAGPAPPPEDRSDDENADASGGCSVSRFGGGSSGAALLIMLLVMRRLMRAP